MNGFATITSTKSASPNPANIGDVVTYTIKLSNSGNIAGTTDVIDDYDEAHITARADRDLSEAVAVVNGKPVKMLAQGPGRRQLSGSLTLTQPGRWSFRFLDPKGRTLAQGPERPVEIVADQPPQVTIEAPSEKAKARCSRPRGPGGRTASARCTTLLPRATGGLVKGAAPRL